MKHLTSTFALLLTFSVFSFAQINTHTNIKTLPPINPKIRNAQNLVVRPQCPDLAAVAINYKLEHRTDAYNGIVKVSGVVKNIGMQAFVSNPRQMTVILFEDIPGRGLIERARRSIGNIPSGGELHVNFYRKWYTGNEFPSTFQVCVKYDPDILLDGNPRNDDCNRRNNCKSRPGSEINKLFRRGS